MPRVERPPRTDKAPRRPRHTQALGAFVRAALAYVALGWAPIPLPARTKNPGRQKWQLERYAAEQITAAFGRAGGIGLLCGEPSGGLLDVDLDTPEARAAWLHFALRTDRQHGRASSPSSHWWYVVDRAPAQTERLRDLDGATLAELRSNGAQTCAPPSIHPSGEQLVWEAEGEPARVDIVDLQRAVRAAASAALLARRWPEGGRHDAAMALSGFLLRAGMAQADAERLVEVVARVAGDVEVKDRVRAVGDTAARLARGECATGGPRLAELLSDGDAVVERLRQWLGLHSPSEAGADDSRALDLWGSHLAGLPPLDLTTLPPVLGDFATDVAERQGCDPALVGLLALGVAAGAIHDQHQLQPRQHDTRWRVSPRLWMTPIAYISGGKTPAFIEACQPLKALDKTYAEADAGKLYEYTLSKRTYDKAVTRWLREGSVGPPPAEPTRPIERRHVVEDFTTEALSDVLIDNQGGVLIGADELAGLIGSIDAYRPTGVAKDRALYLQLYEGGPRRIERIKRGRLYVPNWSASIVGAIQPERLRQLAGHISDDGFMARMTVFVADDRATPVDRRPNHKALDRYSNTIFRLVSLPAPPDAYVLSAAAHARREYVVGITRAVATLPTSSNGLRAALGKWESLFARLLLTWHLTDATSRETTPTSAIGERAADSVARLMIDFLLPHAAHVYGELLGQEHLIEARAIAGHILAHKMERITARDIGQARHSLRGDRRTLDEAMTVLGVAGWVSPLDRQPGQAPTRWQVNGRVHVDFARRAAAEREHREHVRERIRQAAELLGVAGGEA
jgi:hypothetical protein